MKLPKAIQISIPQPCHEDWNNMTPQGQGKFCNSCQKCVVDFTGFSDEQLYKYFAEHKGQKVCGRFQNWQLKRAVALPPEPRNRFYKWFISLGFIISLLELLGSEAKAQEAIRIEASSDKTDECLGCIDGIIINSKHVPISNVKIILKCAGVIIGETRSNKHGKYSFLGIPAGRYELIVQYQNRAQENISGILVNTNDRKTINFSVEKGKIKQRDIDITEYKNPLNESMNTTVITGKAEIELMQPCEQHTIDSVIKDFQPIPAKQKK